MYVNIEKIFNIVQVELPDKKEEINKIKNNVYFSFVCRSFLFKVNECKCTYEEKMEMFVQPNDILNAYGVALDIKHIIETFFYYLRAAQ